MGLLTSIAKMVREIAPRAITDGENILGTVANPIIMSLIDVNGVGGAALALSSDAATTPSPGMTHMIVLPSGANDDVDVVLDLKERVIDAWVVMKGAGTAGSLVTVKNGTSAISDAMDVSGAADKEITRAGEINDATMDIDAAGTLRVSYASTGGDFPGAIVYVSVLKVA